MKKIKRPRRRSLTPRKRGPGVSIKKLIRGTK